MSRDAMLVTSDEGWQGVYIDGVLADQGHSIDWLYVIGELGCNTYRQAVNEDWLEQQGRLPTSNEDIVWADD